MIKEKFNKLKESFKADTLDVVIKTNQNYQKKFNGYLINFEYDVWQSEMTKNIFSDIDMLEVFDTLTDEEIFPTDLQLDELNQIALELVTIEYEEYEHPSEHAFNLGD